LSKEATQDGKYQASVFKVCYLGQQLQRQYEFLCYSLSINLLNTAMIDCPVASIGSTSNKYLLLKSAMVFNTDFKVIIVIGMVS
jgi:hypothetical protein